MNRPRAFWPCVIVSVVAFALFGGIAMQVERDSGLTLSDRQLADELHAHASETPFLVGVADVLSFIGSWMFLVPLGLLIAAAFVRRKQYAIAVVWVLALALGPLMNTIIKHVFQRPRPFPKPVDDWSFPSGHSMNSFIYFGLVTYVLFLVIPRRWVKFAAAASLLCLVILIGCSRMYLTRHYLSDVMGGFAFGAGWMAAWIAVLELVRGRQALPAKTI